MNQTAPILHLHVISRLRRALTLRNQTRECLCRDPGSSHLKRQLKFCNHACYSFYRDCVVAGYREEGDRVLKELS